MPGFPVAFRIQRCCSAFELNNLFKKRVTKQFSHHVVIILRVEKQISDTLPSFKRNCLLGSCLFLWRAGVELVLSWNLDTLSLETLLLEVKFPLIHRHFAKSSYLTSDPKIELEVNVLSSNMREGDVMNLSKVLWFLFHFRTLSTFALERAISG